jgi:cytochrome-b5 reductase
MSTILPAPKPFSYKIPAVLTVCGLGAFTYYSTLAAAPPIQSTLVPGEFIDLKLAKVEQLTPNVKKFTFQLPSNNHELGLSAASLVMAKIKAGDKDVVRPYTPVSEKHAKGYFDLIIKIYPEGKFGQAINSLSVGESVQFKGPMQKFEYKPNMWKHVGMVAGGSGITPCLQVIREIVNNPADKTKVHLLFANNTPADIILKDELEALAAKHSEKLKVEHVIGTAPDDYKAIRGYVTADLLKSKFPGPKEEGVKVLVCGPPPMMNALTGPKAKDFTQGELVGAFKNLGYSPDQVFKY